MNSIKRISVFTLLLIFVVGCKKTKEKNKLVGTWNVTEISISAIILTIPFTDTDPSPTGTITFKAGGQGTQDYTFKFLNDTVTQDDNFTWKIKKGELITGTDDVWERLINEDHLQKIKYTDTLSALDIRTYTITMTK